MRRDQLRTATTLGRVGRVVVIMLIVAATVSLPTAGMAAGESALSIYQATLVEPNQKTSEVSTEELRQILAAKSAVVFDARPYREYAVSHLPGALNVSAKPEVPMSQYVSDVAEIGRLSAKRRLRRSCCTATARSAAKASG